MPTQSPAQEFIDRWSHSEASERANYTLFLSELCDLLELPHPDPSTADDSKNSYVFERNVPLLHEDGRTTTGRIDLYKQGCFVLEAKQGSSEVAAAPLFGGNSGHCKTWTWPPRNSRLGRRHAASQEPGGALRSQPPSR